jgi:Protein of unknown function with PCYCGC motif
MIGAVIVALAGVGAFAMWGRGGAAATPGTPAGQSAAAGQPTSQQVEKARRDAAFGPHKQATLPPIPFAGYEPPRGKEVATAAFVFAAEHPEVASYVPCFCGCQAMGHSGNADCFVKARAANGDVTEWEPHGVECQVCIDVATRSRQMNASGASTTAIRNAVEKEFTARYPDAPKMVLPMPPAPTPASND